MVETIFRVIIIMVIITITLGFLASATVNFDIDSKYLDVIRGFFVIACVILPMKNLLPIFAFVVSITVFKTTVNIVKTIWNLLPISG